MPPTLVERRMRFRLDPHDAAVTGVSLECDGAVPGPRAFARDDTGWRLELADPGLDRLEYRFVVHRGDAADTVLDPANPCTVRTAFGERSVLERPGYAEPAWLSAAPAPGRYDPFTLAGETRHDVPVTVWSPDGLGDADDAPLLLVHDGPEYDDLARLTRYCAASVAAGVLPPHRVALVHPVLRDAWYSGSPAFLRTMADAGLDRLGERYAVAGPVVVMGASLGGLTALLLGLTAAPRVGGVLAQSGSFFQLRHDGAESGFRYFDRISRTVQSILDMRHTDHPLVVGMTCGALEENVANNRDMAAALRRAGHDVRYREVRDLHNYTAWRDALDPALTDVLRSLWCAPGADA
ncbi:alpha/beta hydrolase-fold protein [Phycicoccus duodecadis]|nr:alpha/beta hydrolase-fold protein [Phycicoccus duodecadis]